MKNLTWQNPEQLFVAQELINKVKSKCCGIKAKKEIEESIVLEVFTDTNDESESLRIICNLKIDVTMEIVKHAKRIGRKILGDDLTNKISNLRL